MTRSVPQSVADAVALLHRHAAVLRVEAPVPADADTFRVEIFVEVELPSRAKPEGVSSSGVKSQELVVLDFDSDWPAAAPSIGLRKDFPRCFPHVDPYTIGDYVRPCVYNGSVSDLMHREGLDKIIDQIVGWLNKAAADNLVNPRQGWEPTRRDQLAGTIVFDADRMVQLVRPDGKPVQLPAVYTGLNEYRRFAIASYPERHPETWFTYDQKRDKFGRWFNGFTSAFLVGATHVNGAAPIADAYEPETVGSLADLGAKATQYGMDGAALLQALETFFVASQKAAKTFGWMGEFFSAVIMAVQRPLPLISAHGRSVELLPYVVMHSPLTSTKFQTHTKVEPAFHMQSLTPQVLRSMSGTTTANTAQSMIFLGCGSLGSKVSLHLARAGFGNQSFVDNDVFNPHNAARHALLERPEAKLFSIKSMLMQSALQELGHAPLVALYEDAASVLQSDKAFRAVVPSDTSLIVDATASLQVAEAACISHPLTSFEGRYVRTAMLGQGSACFLALEGPGRSVRVDDLLASLYGLCRYDPAQRARMAGKDADPERVFVGENCSSATTVMTDSVVSRSAALVAAQLERWFQRGFPACGALGIGVEDASGIGMQWTTRMHDATTVLRTESDGGWELRILANVVVTITADVQQWRPKETGGALVGHVYPWRRCIVIADVVDAPLDSKRSPGRFVLGVDGLEDAVRDVHRDTLGHVHLIGTWHSHPGGGPLSPTDFSTLNKIAMDGQGLPVVSLVWTPSGFLCEVQTTKLTG